MKSPQVINKVLFYKKGFIAVTAVMVMACIVFLFESVVLQSAVNFADNVTNHEWRIQANLNVQSCVSAIAIMSAKDYFLTGNLSLPEYGCLAVVTRDHTTGTVSIHGQSKFMSISSSILDQSFDVP